MTAVDLISLRFGSGRGAMPPLGSMSLAACLSAADISWQIHDTQLDAEFSPFSVEKLTSLITSTDAPVVGLSVFNDAVPLVIAALERIHERLRGRRIFIGGPGTVGIGHQLVERLEQVDVTVIVGEADTLFPRLLASPKLQSPGKFSRGCDGKIVGSGQSPREELNRLPYLPWEWCRKKGYKIVPLSTSRGCPFNCQFCEIIAFMGRRVTKFAMDRVGIELRQAMACVESQRISILDDTFTLDRKRVREFCKMVRGLGVPIRFGVFSRVDTIDEERLEALASAGCERIFFGVDGGDDDVLQRISKDTTIAKARESLMLAARYVNVVASFVWGYPFESVESCRRMVGFAEELATARTLHRIDPQLHLLSPSAGTPLFEEFGDKLVFDMEVECLPLRSSLCDSGFREGFGAVLKVIKSSPVLAAPFYRYENADFDDKQRTVQKFQRTMDRQLGQRFLTSVSK